jgi:regulatory protein
VALRLLGRRDYTTAEIRAKLLDRGYPVDDVQSAIERLTADGLLDDRRVAAAWLRTASRIKGRGGRRIEQELLARGVDRSLAADLVSGISVQDETASIDRILMRRKAPAHPTPAERRKLFQSLQRRGFSSDAISSALRARRTGGDDEGD